MFSDGQMNYGLKDVTIEKQEDIYNAFFLELEDAVNKIDPTKDVYKRQQLFRSCRT